LKYFIASLQYNGAAISIILSYVFKMILWYIFALAFFQEEDTGGRKIIGYIVTILGVCIMFW